MARLLKLLINLSLLSSVISICSDGCVKCNGNNKCLICDATSLYVNVNGTCVSQDLEFCILSFDMFTCVMCFKGYYLELNNKCVSNPAGINEITNCEYYQSYTRCTQCKKNFYLANNGRACSSIAKQIANCEVYSAANTCLYCADSILETGGKSCTDFSTTEPRCMFYSKDTRCTSCIDGYYLEPNYFVINIISMYKTLMSAMYLYKRTYNSTFNFVQCQKILDIPNCGEINNDGTCSFCNSGYYLEMPDKTRCIKNPKEIVVVPDEDIPYCQETFHVTETVNSVSTQITYCRFCYNKFYLTSSYKKCQPQSKNINNCGVYSQTIDGECLQCTGNYYRKDDGAEKCVKRGSNLNCMTINPLSMACSECNSKFPIKYYSDQYCDAEIISCEIYNYDNEVLSCKQCFKGFYYDTSTRKCSSDVNFDAYCRYYNSNKKCEKCNLGYFLNTITEICEANDLEYQSFSNCESYHVNQKNICTTCPNYHVLTPVTYVCKLFTDDANSITDKNDFVQNCNQFEIDLENTFKCKEPYNGNVNGDTYFVNTTTNKPVKNTKSITDCATYSLYHTATTGNKCSVCNPNFEGEIDFAINDMCSPSDYKICDNGKGPSKMNNNKDICYKPLNICGSIEQGSINTNNCPPCNDPSYVYKPCSANYKGDCEDRDANGICTSITGSLCGIETKFKRTVNYKIYMSTDKNFCIREQIYSDDKCYQTSNGYCLLCQTDYYPDMYKVFNLQKDVIIAYASRAVSSTSVMLNCIIYNAITAECEKCTTGFGLISNRNKICTACTSNNKVFDVSDIYCADLVKNDFPNTCYRMVSDTIALVSNFCIECKSGNLYQFNYTELYMVDDLAYVYENKSKTNLQRPIKNFTLTGCFANSTAFYNVAAYASQSVYCEWGIKSNDSFLCQKCVFGYWGEIDSDKLNQKFVQNCVADQSCNTSSRHIIDDPNVAKMVSCHLCTRADFIPTIFLYPKQYSTVPTFIFADNPNAVQRPTQCYFRGTQVDVNCLIQMRVSGDDLKKATALNGVNRDYICLACKPKYRATYQMIENLYPFKFVIQCNFIANCASSYTANKCEECEVYNNPNDTVNSGFVLNTTTQTCSLVDTTIMGFCNIIVSRTLCATCKNGYILADKCVSISSSDCLYYQSNRCVQSKLAMGVTANVIELRTYSEYKIPQANCINSNLTKITKCKFYNSSMLCIYCDTDYYVGDSGKSCYKREIENCMTYNDTTMKCSACIPEYSLSANICVAANDTIPPITYCKKYSNDLCVECDSGYKPFLIKSGKGSICLDVSTFMTANLCEEIDETAIASNTLSCNRCKTLASVVDSVKLKTMTISSNDFINTLAYTGSVSASGLLSYSEILNQYSYIRVALYKQVNRQWCRRYGGIVNCSEFDDENFTNTFLCNKCTTNFYLKDFGCKERKSDVSNCIEYAVTSDECNKILGSSEYAVDYSTFDKTLISSPAKDFVDTTNTDIGIEGCVAYVDDETCLYCNSTKYLYDNLCLSVTLVVSDCVIYSTDGICSHCNEGFLLLQNKCLLKYAANCDNYLTNTNCAVCSPAYPSHSLSGDCEKVADITNCDVYRAQDSCFYCDSNFRNNKGMCSVASNFTENCERNGTNDTCQKCKDGYYVSTDGKTCIVNPTFDKNCKEFDTSPTCIVCRPNYYFKNDSCYICKTDQRACLFCEPYNPSMCAICKSGYYMDNNFDCIRQVGFVQNIVLIQAKNLNNQMILGNGAAMIKAAWLLVLTWIIAHY